MPKNVAICFNPSRNYIWNQRSRSSVFLLFSTCVKNKQREKQTENKKTSCNSGKSECIIFFIRCFVTFEFMQTFYSTQTRTKQKQKKVKNYSFLTGKRKNNFQQRQKVKSGMEKTKMFYLLLTWRYTWVRWILYSYCNIPFVGKKKKKSKTLYETLHLSQALHSRYYTIRKIQSELVKCASFTQNNFVPFLALVESLRSFSFYFFYFNILTRVSLRSLTRLYTLQDNVECVVSNIPKRKCFTYFNQTIFHRRKKTFVCSLISFSFLAFFFAFNFSFCLHFPVHNIFALMCFSLDFFFSVHPFIHSVTSPPLFVWLYMCILNGVSF